MIALDLSRLLSRAGRGTPTGIDRVGLAYAEHFIRSGGPLCFTAITASGRLGLLQRRAALKFIAAIGAAWRGVGDRERQDQRARQIARQARLQLLATGERALIAHLRGSATPPIYLLVSHHHLERRAIIARVKERAGARFVSLIHDLIPVEFPEYAKPGQAENHLRRIETAAELSDAVIV